MNNAPCNAWNAPTAADTFLNGSLIAAGLVGLLLSVLQPAIPEVTNVAQADRTTGLILSEAKQA